MTAATLTTAPARLLGRPPATTLADHRARFGPLRLPSDLVGDVGEADVRGRGGAGFPTAVKMTAVRQAVTAGRRRRRAVVVANGTEGEPASAKDRMLLALAPHLVIDGMVAAAVAVGADCGVLCVGRRDGRTLTAVRAALAERRGADPVDLDVAAVPSRYVAGEETALVAWLNGGDARPTFSLDRPAQRGVDGRPTLVDNVETLAHVGVVALAGARPAAGTTLVTVRDGDRPPAVQEVEVGTPLSAVLAPTGGAVLVGGYFGTWLTAAEAAAARMSSESLAAVGASPGCGLVAAMPAGHCPLQEVAAVTWWLAANSAGQCGPCVNGLPAIARAVAALATGTGTPGERGDLDRWLAVTAGRGTCKLPDGAGRFVASAMRACAGHVEHHRRYGPCPPNHRQLLPTPALDAWR